MAQSPPIRIEPQARTRIAHIRIRGYPEDVFEVFFFEVFHADEKNLLGPDLKVRWCRLAGGGWETNHRRPGVGEYLIRLLPRDDEIEMEWRLKNNSAEEWNT